jgi:drug/metabolite transporter (DMT)-like permease
MRTLLAWWIACLLWSSTYLFVKLGVGEIPPLSFAWVRLVSALAVLAPITLVRNGFSGLSQRDVARIFAAGVLLLGVNYGLLYWGTQSIPSGLVAILQSATPVFALVFGWGFGLEQVTPRKVLALAAGCAGVAVIFRSDASASGSGAFAGSIAVLGSSACIAFAYVWLKGRTGRVHPVTVTTIQCAAGALVLAPVGLITEGNPLNASWSAASIAALLYLAFCGSVVAFWLNYWLLSRMDASAMLMMGIAEVPIAVALGAAVFGERLPPGALAGAACVLVGVGLTSIKTSAAPRDQCAGKKSQPP